MIKYIYIIVLLVFSACNAYKDIPVHKLELGMTIPQVQTIVKKKMIQVSMSEDNGIKKQTFQVQKRIVRGGIARQQRFNLFFKNGQLTGYDKDSEKFSF